MTHDEKIVEAVATAEVRYDGYEDLLCLSRTMRERYLDRARAAITAYQAEAWQGEEAEYEIWQDDMPVAGASGPRDRAFAEAMHYAQVYGQDGPVSVCEVVRLPVPLPPAPKATP